MNGAERVLRRVDGYQQRHTPLAVLVGVVKKYGDDNAGNLTVQLTYAFFTTVFPLLLILVTVLNLVLAGDPGARQSVLHSTFGEFPIVGRSLASDIHPLRSNSVLSLAVGLLFLLYGTTGLASAGIFAMEQVWNLPGPQRPGFVPRLLRSFTFLGVLAVGLVATTVLSGFGTFGSHDVTLGVLAEFLAALLNVALYLAAFRALTPKQVPTRNLVPGVVAAGIVWTVLQAVGGYVVGHDLKHASATYGMFALVLGLVAWLYLGARVTVYAAELNAVLAHRLWPRSIVQPPLTEADQRSLALQATENQRRPEQQVASSFTTVPQTQDEFRDNGYRAREGAGHEHREPPGRGDGGT